MAPAGGTGRLLPHWGFVKDSEEGAADEFRRELLQFADEVFPAARSAGKNYESLGSGAIS